MNGISGFILTFNSEKYLDRIISALGKCCDEIVVVDSGSSDSTRAIAEKYGCKFFVRPLDNFKAQRAFATEQCSCDLVLMVDSDEIPDDVLILSLKSLRNSPEHLDAYRIQRDWVVLGKKVHAIYPVVSPDFPVRLFDKRRCNFDSSSIVHEEPAGYRNAGILAGTLSHLTFETREELAAKLERYSSLSATTLLEKRKPVGIISQWLSSLAAFFKWYALKGGWKDGAAGVVLAKYAFDYTFLKYRKARAFRKDPSVKKS